MSCEVDIERAIRAGGRRLTVQRAKIVTALRHGGDHQTAESIHARVLEDEPHAGISLSTVYRTLETLQEIGLVSALDSGSGTVSYEWSTPERPHHHLVCHRCEGVTEIELPALAGVQGQIRERTGFQPDFDHLGITGLCAACAAADRDDE
jgi:Fur family ferric uptake transcriptional regulator